MPRNVFESSRISEGTLNTGAQKLSGTSHDAPEESKVISRDDVRDGFARGRRAETDNSREKEKHSMATVATMEDLFLDEIRDLYDAEKQLTKALPKMAKASSSDKLRKAFEDHLAETQNQVRRLEEIFEHLDKKSSGKKCAAMSGLISEGEELAGNADDTAVRDAGLIAAAQKVEHYEISGYGSARTHAQILGYVEAVSLLEETLSEEKQADRKLNDLAESRINDLAANAGEEATPVGAGHRATPGSRTAGGR